MLLDHADLHRRADSFAGRITAEIIDRRAALLAGEILQPSPFSLVLKARMLKLGWSLRGIRSAVERDLAQGPNRRMA